LKTTWRDEHRLEPSGIPASVKKIRAAIPKTISGVTSVIVTSASSGRGRASTSSAARVRSMVPRMQATTALPAAITSELRRASVTAVSRRAAPNHLVEKPSQTRSSATAVVNA
jgi:hypothetical protein